jgi:hypothetical protein
MNYSNYFRIAWSTHFFNSPAIDPELSKTNIVIVSSLGFTFSLSSFSSSITSIF